MPKIKKKFPTNGDLEPFFSPIDINQMNALKGTNTCRVYVDRFGNGYMVSPKPKYKNDHYPREYKLEFQQMEANGKGGWWFPQPK